MNEMRKWINAMEAISVADVEAIVIPPIHDVGNWNRHGDVAKSVAEIVRLTTKVREVLKQYIIYSNAKGLIAVGSDDLTDYLDKFDKTLKTIFRDVNRLNGTYVMEDEVLVSISDKMKQASDEIKRFHAANRGSFEKSRLKDTNVKSFMDVLENFYKTLARVAGRVKFHL